MKLDEIRKKNDEEITALIQEKRNQLKENRFKVNLNEPLIVKNVGIISLKKDN